MAYKRLRLLAFCAVLLLTSCSSPRGMNDIPSWTVLKKSDFTLHLKDVSGEVSVVRGLASLDAVPQQLYPGDEIVCGPKGGCRVTIGGDDYFILDENTNLFIDSLTTNEVDAEPYQLHMLSLRVNTGRLFCAVTESNLNWSIHINIKDKAAVFYNAFAGGFGIDATDLPTDGMAARVYNFTAPMLMGGPASDENARNNCSPGQDMWLNEFTLPISIDIDDSALPEFFKEWRKEAPVNSALSK